MKNIKISRLFAAAMFVAVLVLSGCKQPDEETHYKIEGTWVDSSGQKFVITNTELKNYWMADTLGYTGNNLVVQELSDNSGTIFIKYTRSYDSSSSTYYSENAPDVGKWYAVSYKSLTDNSAEIAGAYKSTGVTSCATLEEAKTEFTADHGYYGTYNTFTKQ